MSWKVSFLASVMICCAVLATAQTMTMMNEGVVPVVIRSPGLNDSTWTTSLYLTQVGGLNSAVVTLTLLNPDGDDWSSSVTMPAARGSMEINDVVTAVDAGIGDGKYILQWWSTEPIMLGTRTFTNEATGSYGQGIASVAPGSGFATDDQVIFPAPMDVGNHRVNVGVANSGLAEQTFTIEAVDAGGTVIDSWRKVVGAGAITQLRTNEQASGAGSLVVRCTAGCDGSGFAYASVVVNDSNDAFFLYAGAAAAATGYAPVTTTRDQQGIWYITGGSLYDVFEAMGYAVAFDRLWQAETFRRQARGTLAEVFGSSYASTDIFMRITGYSEAELQQAFQQLDGESKAVIQGYVDGFNRRIAEVVADLSQLPFEFHAVGLATTGTPLLPAPWTVADVLAWVAVLQRNFDCEAFDTGILDNAELYQALGAAYPSDAMAMFADLRWINDPAAQTMIPATASSKGRPALPLLKPQQLPDLGGAGSRLRAARRERIELLEKINAYVKMGSYAWVVAGERTASGNPILYSGPQMGFMTPSIVLEGSIRGGGLNISGMTVAGIPGLIIGRTPHHAWSMQVGHAHTVDFYLESPANISLHRWETIRVAGGGSDLQIPVYRSSHGPVIEPVPYDPAAGAETILSWKYSHWGYELDIVGFALGVARATSVKEFGDALTKAGVSQHFCYADRDGNIAYWMSGREPVRPDGIETRLPLPGDGSAEWDATVRQPLPHDSNPAQGYYGGWNNKSELSYNNPPNCLGYSLGIAHRAHVVDEYLAANTGLSYEQVRDLALNIAATDSSGGGGIPWSFVADRFTQAVQGDSTPEREAALTLLTGWDGHFVAGGQESWATATTRADAWVLQERWIEEMVRLTFADELNGAELGTGFLPTGVQFNVLLRALAGSSAALPTLYDWFQDRSDSGLPTDPDELILLALDNTLRDLGPQPWQQERGYIRYQHDILGEVPADPTPFASRSTYAQCVEYDNGGLIRLETMFPLGQSGTILAGEFGLPVYDDNFFSMEDVFNAFTPRPFPLFD